MGDSQRAEAVGGRVECSPLCAATSVPCYFVANSDDWEAFGAAAWGEMIAALDASPASQRVLGVDTEWYRKNPLATLQAATATHCIVLHLSYLRERLLPPPVRAALERPDIIKCGVGLRNDISRLLREQKVALRGVCDVGEVAVYMGQAAVGSTNLKALARTVCGLSMEKRESITRSNWELPLTEAQVGYCADDAVASYMIGRRLLSEVTVEKLFNGDVSADVAGWVTQHGADAAAAFKRQQKDKQRAENERRKYEALASKLGTSLDPSSATGDDNGGGGGSGTAPSITTEVLAAQQAADRVRVLNRDGNFLFTISAGRATFYVEDKGLAKVTVANPSNPRKAQEIQLLFDPQVKTRLCMYYNTGYCEMGDNCPFAHGIEQLTPEALAMAMPDRVANSSAQQKVTSEQIQDASRGEDAAGTDKNNSAAAAAAPTHRTPTCAGCFTNRKLMRHSIVPPSFRRYLPPPYHCPGDADFLPLCTQCNSLVRHFYDAAMKKTYTEAEEAERRAALELAKAAEEEGGGSGLQPNASLSALSEGIQMEKVNKCVAYAKLLLNERSLKKVPEARQRVLREYIATHWPLTHIGDTPKRKSKRSRRHKKNRRGGKADLDRSGETQDGTPDDQTAAADKEEGKGSDDGNAAGVADRGSHSRPEHERDNNNSSDGEEEEEEEEDSHDENGNKDAKKAENPAGKETADGNAAASSTAVPKQVEKSPAAFEFPHDNDPDTVTHDFLVALSAVVPGEVRARVTMRVLVGDDTAKAAEFVERWRRLCFTECGMQHKASNELTQLEWNAYREQENKKA